MHKVVVRMVGIWVRRFEWEIWCLPESRVVHSNYRRYRRLAACRADGEAALAARFGLD